MEEAPAIAALDSRDRHVPVKATHRANAEPAELQTPGAARSPAGVKVMNKLIGLGTACSPASELSGIDGLGSGHPATDLVNNTITPRNQSIWLGGELCVCSFVALTRNQGLTAEMDWNCTLQVGVARKF